MLLMFLVKMSGTMRRNELVDNVLSAKTSVYLPFYKTDAI